MAVKSVIEVDIDVEGKLGAYVKKYKEYEDALKKTPNIWAKAGKEAAGAATSFEAGLAALLAMLDTASQLADQTDKVKKGADDVGSSWKGAARWSKQFAENIGHATLSLAKWVGIGSLASSLLGGIGGIWAIDRLAGSAGASRRSAQGLGLSIGQQKAFEVDLGRVIDPDSFLGGVSEALGDRQKRANLFRAGLTNADLVGKNTFQVSIAALQSIKKLVDATNPNAWGNLIEQRNLGAFGINTVEDARRLHANDVSTYIKQARDDQGAFGFDDATAAKWQELDRTLDASKTKIESTFIRGLAPLAGPLAHLSDAVSTAIENFLGMNDPKRFKVVAAAIDKFASYIASPKFQTDMATLAANIALIAKETVRALEWFHLIPTDTDKNKPPIKTSDVLMGIQAGTATMLPVIFGPGAAATAIGGYTVDAAKWIGNNIGNLRVPGQSAFQRFPTVDAGILGEYRQIRRSTSVHGLKNIEELIGGRIGTDGKPHWGLSPASDHNNVAAYVRALTNATGLGAHDAINTNDAQLMAKLIAAISQVEGRHRVSPQVVLKVINATGGSAVVGANQLRH